MRIITDSTEMDLEKIHKLLNQTYWASRRSFEVMKKSIEHSECIAIYDENELVGFSRIVTDYSTVFWLCDVVVDRAYRGKGIGKMMMEFLTSQEYYKDLKGILATRDAHGLYEQYGFKKDTEKCMTKDRGVIGS